MFSWRSRSRVTSVTVHSVSLGAAARVAQRPHAKPQPVHRLALEAGDPHLLLGAAAFARRLEQAIDRLRHVGIADEHPLDRPHVIRIAGIGQIEIGGIGIDHPAARIGDQEAVEGLVDHRLQHRARAGFSAGHTQDAGRQRKQRKHPGHGEEGQQRQDIRPGVAAADQQQADGGADERNRDQHNHADAAAAAATLAAIEGGGPGDFVEFLRGHDQFQIGWRARRNDAPRCLSRGLERKGFAHAVHRGSRHSPVPRRRHRLHLPPGLRPAAVS